MFSRVSPVTLAVVIALVAAAQTQGKPEEKSEDGAKYVVSRVTPLYPLDARAHRLEGAGVFQLSIDRESGAVINVTTIKTTG